MTESSKEEDSSQFHFHLQKKGYNYGRAGSFHQEKILPILPPASFYNPMVEKYHGDLYHIGKIYSTKHFCNANHDQGNWG